MPNTGLNLNTTLSDKTSIDLNNVTLPYGQELVNEALYNQINNSNFVHN